MRSMLGSMDVPAESADKMAISLAGLAGDMASFYNISQEDAYEKLKSGMSGQVRALESVGVVMTDANLKAFALSKGYKGNVDDLDAASKETLRYQFIMAATAKQQGDFARTSGTFANQLRITKNNLTTLAASIGELLLPELNKLLGYINILIKYITNLSAAQKEHLLHNLLIAAPIVTGKQIGRAHV